METFASTVVLLLVTAVSFLSFSTIAVGFVMVFAGLVILAVTTIGNFVALIVNPARGWATALRLFYGGMILVFGGMLAAVLSLWAAEYLEAPIVAPVVATPLFVVVFVAVARTLFRWQPPVGSRVPRAQKSD